jgi:hypothetical protein
MLGALWKKTSREEEERANRTAEQLSQLVDFFPIGDKVNYYPEYQQDICFETIVLGYELNGQALYERDQVRKPDGGAPEFVLEQSGETVIATDMPEFAIIVPDTSELEKTLDYFSMAAIGRSGQFLRGNSITLLSKQSQQGTPSVDTSVDGRTLVKAGYYQGTKVVKLIPKLDTLGVVDHREQARLALALPCILFPDPDTDTGLEAQLIDASEHCVGIKLKEQADVAVFQEKSAVRLSLPMPALDRVFNLTGRVHASRDHGALIIDIQGIDKTGMIEEMQLVDRLDLRACLVQCSRDQRDGGGQSTIELVC